MNKVHDLIMGRILYSVLVMGQPLTGDLEPVQGLGALGRVCPRRPMDLEGSSVRTLVDLWSTEMFLTVNTIACVCSLPSSSCFAKEVRAMKWLGK